MNLLGGTMDAVIRLIFSVIIVYPTERRVYGNRFPDFLLFRLYKNGERLI